MKYTDANELITRFVKIAYGAGISWDITITTPFAKSGRNDDANGYKLIVHKDGVRNAIAESKEIFGYRRNAWTADTYGEFLATLKPVNNG